MNLDVENVDQRLADIQTERIRRLREEAMRWYEPHPKQLRFHQAQHPIRALVGANKIGKSYAGSMEMAWAVGKVHPYRENHSGPVYGRYCCVDFPTLRETIIPIFKEILPRKACILDGETKEGNLRKWPGLRGDTWKTSYNKEEKVIHLADGSKIEMKSYDQDPESFEGPVRHIIGHDEEPPEWAYGANLSRQMTVQSNIFFTLTPLNYSQWLYMLISEQSVVSEQVFMVSATVYDSPYINKDVIAVMEEQITDEAERAARLYGQFTYKTGRVWKEFGDHNLLDEKEIPREWERIISIDPHDNKPAAVTWCAVDPYDSRLYFYREAWISDVADEISKQIIALSAGEKISTWVVDPSSKRGAKIHGRGSIIDQLRVRLPGLVEADNFIKEGGRDIIRGLVKDQPGRGPDLYVMRSCPRLYHQMLNYSWKPPTKTGEDRRKPTVYKKSEDFCDCVLQTIQFVDFEQGKMVEGFGVGIYGNPPKSEATFETFNFRGLG